MSAQPPSDPPALVTIDLSGGDETPAAAAGRIIGGLVLMIVGGVVAIGLFAAYLLGWLWEPIADWVELFDDGLLFVAAIGLGIAITGFTIMRRGRKVRAQEAAEAADVMARLQAAGALDGTATPETIASAMEGPRTGDMDVSMQKPIPADGQPGSGKPGAAGSATGAETHL